jgi:Flp pilus assembly protein TadD
MVDDSAAPGVKARFRVTGKMLGIGVLVGSIVVALVAAIIFLPALWQANTARRLTRWCQERNLPNPWEGEEAVAETLTGEVTDARLMERLDELISQRFELYDGSGPPDRIRTVGELHAAQNVGTIPLEAALYGVAVARATGRDWAVCTPESQTIAAVWKRPFAVCSSDGVRQYGLHLKADVQAWRVRSDEEVLALYLAAAAELPLPAREAYRLMGAARELVDSPDLLFRLGAVKIANGASEFGIEDLREALQAGAPIEGHLELGDSLMQVGLPDQALTAYGNLLAVDPDNALGSLGNARALGTLGRVDEAAAILVTLQDTHPELPGLWHALSLVYERQGKSQEAIAALRKEIDQHPQREHYERLTALYVTAQRGDEVVPLLRKEYAAHPDAYLALLIAQAMAKDGAASEKWLATALKNHPDNMELLAFSAQLLLNGRKYREAEELLMRLSGRDPENLGLEVQLAMCRFALEKAGEKGHKDARKTAAELARRQQRELFRLAGLLSKDGYIGESEEILELRLVETGVEGELTTWLYFLYLDHGKKTRAQEFRVNQLPKYTGEHRDWVERTMDNIDRYVAKHRIPKGNDHQK